MTPEEARRLLDGTTPGPWEPHPDYPMVLVNLDQKMAVAAIPGKPEDSTPEDKANLTLIAAAPDLAATIAGMTTEYAIEYQPNPSSEWYRVSDWSEEYPLIDGEELNPRERIGKRYVTAP